MRSVYRKRCGRCELGCKQPSAANSLVLQTEWRNGPPSFAIAREEIREETRKDSVNDTMNFWLNLDKFEFIVNFVVTFLK